MSEHVGYIVKINELHKHSNADRLQIATIFSNNVIVDLNTQIGDIGIYFPIDLQLSEEYCKENDLVRRKDENGNPAGGYLDPEKRNIRAMKLRGEKSEGLFMPLTSLAYTGETKFEVGNKIDIVNGHEICRKYIPRGKSSVAAGKQGNKTRKHSVPIAPLFAEHADTEQLVYNMNAFKLGDQIEITLKMHGTSFRVAHLPVFQGYKRSLLDRLFHREGTPIYDWDYISGTRRCVLSSFDGGFYGNNEFRKPVEDFFRGKLYKNETVYGEIVGYVNESQPIMPSVSNKKTNDKKFIKQYGEDTVFSYNCEPGQSDFYVYRMTMTNEDGDVVEYTPDFMRYRCEQMGAKCVPVMWRGYLDEPDDWTGDNFNPGEFVKQIAEEYYDGPDPIGKTHVREGVVIRIVNRPKFCAYKHKNWYFKCIEGIIKNDATIPDMEEAEELKV